MILIVSHVQPEVLCETKVGMLFVIRFEILFDAIFADLCKSTSNVVELCDYYNSNLFY